jgi:hypothetical protein
MPLQYLGNMRSAGSYGQEAAAQLGQGLSMLAQGLKQKKMEQEAQADRIMTEYQKLTPEQRAALVGTPEYDKIAQTLQKSTTWGNFVKPNESGQLSIVVPEKPNNWVMGKTSSKGGRDIATFMEIGPDGRPTGKTQDQDIGASAPNPQSLTQVTRTALDPTTKEYTQYMDFYGIDPTTGLPGDTPVKTITIGRDNDYYLKQRGYDLEELRIKAAKESAKDKGTQLTPFAKALEEASDNLAVNMKSFTNDRGVTSASAMSGFNQFKNTLRDSDVGSQLSEKELVAFAWDQYQQVFGDANDPISAKLLSNVQNGLVKQGFLKQPQQPVNNQTQKKSIFADELEEAGKTLGWLFKTPEGLKKDNKQPQKKPTQKKNSIIGKTPQETLFNTIKTANPLLKVLLGGDK